MTSNILDLDAARRESAFPEGIIVKLGGAEYTLPSELPADTFDPFLAPEFDLSGLIVALFKDEDGKGKDIGERAVDLLVLRPALPAEVIAAFYASLELLFGEEQWATFKTKRPSVPDLGRLVSGLFRLYGTSLGEAFASAGSFTTAGPTSKPTSLAATPDSTPEPSGDAQAPEAGSSESVA
jgi:hypothetical protein